MKYFNESRTLMRRANLKYKNNFLHIGTNNEHTHYNFHDNMLF